jgi:hypothetical protein
MAQQDLARKLALLEKQVERNTAYNEVQNLMSKYEYYHCCGMHSETADLFARREDTIAEVGTWGLFKGWDSVKRLYAGLHVQVEGHRAGRMFEHSLTTPVIEVAGDCKTAKGVWISPGNETTLDETTGKAQAAWCNVKYAVDFINEKGKWWIWHSFVFLTFYAFFEKSWAEGGEHPSVKAGGSITKLPPELLADAPSIMRHQPYSPYGMRDFLPAFPEPYETYDEKEGVWWIDPSPRKPRQGSLLYDPTPWRKQMEEKIAREKA